MPLRRDIQQLKWSNNKLVLLGKAEIYIWGMFQLIIGNGPEAINIGNAAIKNG